MAQMPQLWRLTWVFGNKKIWWLCQSTLLEYQSLFKFQDPPMFIKEEHSHRKY